MLDGQELQAAIDAKPAPKVTEQSIKDRIAEVEYHEIAGTTLTLCIITMTNGFTFRGESACASPENFDPEIGMSLAYKDAFRKIWSHEAYLLRERLSATPEIELAAKTAHEAIRSLQIANAEPTIAPVWDEVGEDIRTSCFVGIQRVIDNPNITSEELHDSWIETKESQGWKFGEVRSDEDKTHPCMVPYQELPMFQRLKDHMFRTVVKAVLGL